jgi:hypothetical protein
MTIYTINVEYRVTYENSSNRTTYVDRTRKYVIIMPATGVPSSFAQLTLDSYLNNLRGTLFTKDDALKATGKELFKRDALDWTRQKAIWINENGDLPICIPCHRLYDIAVRSIEGTKEERKILHP